MTTDDKLHMYEDDLVIRNEIEEQRHANESALPYNEEYATHRDKVMQQLLGYAGSEASRSLCLLGAGNCYDADLARLTEQFAEVHLVDLDRSAVERARSELTPEAAAKVVLHAPVDLTGMLPHLAAWSRFQVTADVLMSHPQTTEQAIAASVGGPFDIVASTCVLTQLQLAVLQALGEKHRLFQAVRHTLTVTHLRTLAGLTRAGGHTLLFTDLVSTDRLTLPNDPSPDALRATFDAAIKQGNVIYVAHPEMLRSTVSDDPSLRSQLSAGDLKDVWLWQQGPNRKFLTYVLAFDRRDQTMPIKDTD